MHTDLTTHGVGGLCVAGKCGERTLFPALAITHLADYGTLPTLPAGDVDTNASRVLLEIERQTCLARLAAIDKALTNPASPNQTEEAPRGGSSTRCTKLRMRHVGGA